MRIQRIDKFMVAFVRQRIGIDGRTKQTQSDYVASDAVAILAVSEQTYSVPRLTEISPSMSRYFEFCFFPRGVSMGRTRHGSKGSLGPAFVSPDINWKERSQESPSSMPLHAGPDLEKPLAIVESVLLNNTNVVDLAADSNRGAYRPGLDLLWRLARLELQAFGRIGSIDIPSFELPWYVGKEPDLVGAIRCRFSLVFLIVQRCNRAIGTDYNSEEFVFQLSVR